MSLGKIVKLCPKFLKIMFATHSYKCLKPMSMASLNDSRYFLLFLDALQGCVGSILEAKIWSPHSISEV